MSISVCWCLGVFAGDWGCLWVPGAFFRCLELFAGVLGCL